MADPCANYYDVLRDGRSEARYEGDPSAEPEQWEVDHARYISEGQYQCIVDERVYGIEFTP